MIDRYQIASQLGEDVLGAVYLADDTMLQRRVMCRHIEYGDNADAKAVSYTHLTLPTICSV